MKVLVTGAAGFIGFHVVDNLLEKEHSVIGLDSLNNYYHPKIKFDRLSELGIKVNKDSSYNDPIKSKTKEDFTFLKLNLEDQENIFKLLESEKFDAVCHLAAQAGVRFSITSPQHYISSNINGFFNILEGCRQSGIRNFSFASSSSVYGLNESLPYSVKDPVAHPVSLYAASKLSNELLAHSYSHLFSIRTTGLRFFTVYGPWGRPDMAYFIFSDAIFNNKTVKLYNEGKSLRDFTFIDDVSEAVINVIEKPADSDVNWNSKKPSMGSSSAPFKIYNFGNNKPVNILKVTSILEELSQKKLKVELMPIEAGDVSSTHADISESSRDFNFSPSTTLESGLASFLHWYKNYNAIS